MNSIENDMALRKLIREIPIESPGPGFSARVMETILAEEKDQVPAYITEPILGKKFWFLVWLFVMLGVVFLIFQTRGSGTPESLIIPGLPPLPHIPVERIKDFWSLFLEKAGSLPITIAVSLLAVSALMLADRYFSVIKRWRVE